MCFKPIISVESTNLRLPAVWFRIEKRYRILEGKKEAQQKWFS